jgi:hypothetical protein
VAAHEPPTSIAPRAGGRHRIAELAGLECNGDVIAGATVRARRLARDGAVAARAAGAGRRRRGGSAIPPCATAARSAATWRSPIPPTTCPSSPSCWRRRSPCARFGGAHG